MTINEYQQACLKTIPKKLYRGEQTLMSLMGLNSKAGECIDIYSKVLYHGEPLDKEAMCKKLGDVACYLAVCADAFDYDLESVFKMNVEKLKVG